MFQYTTFIPLASSKSYFTCLNDCKKHLAECVKQTNEYRKKKNEPPLSREEIEQGQRLLRLNIAENIDVMQMLGTSKEINFEQLERKYVPEYQKTDMYTSTNPPK